MRRVAVLAVLAAAIVPTGLGGRTAPVGRTGVWSANDWRTETRSALRTDLLYVCIQDEAKIAVVDMGAKSVVRTIDLTTLGFPATAKPHYIVVEPDGAHWYVSLIGANRVVKFTREDKIAGQFEMETPGMLSLSPQGGAPSK